ncbi:hypothetical protein BY458DRAFT_497029 [Sporodiniella umbellata]|nr:hypothetical protein BY458DRAFT_497029 [Sporodiniella umbellata]
MSYHYQSTTIKTRENETTFTSVTVSEINETEGIGIEERSLYEISDEDRLTEHDFLSLMNSEEEEDSDSEIEDWFPSLLRRSAIEFLESDTSDTEHEPVEAIVHEEEEGDEDDEDSVQISSTGKRSPRYKQRQRKRVKPSDQVPIEVNYIILSK